MPDSEASVRKTVETVWRMEAPRLIGGLLRVTGELGRAEELAQEALLVALTRWPETGIPPNPGAWLMATAKHRAIDEYRKSAMQQRKHEALAREAVEEGDEEPIDAFAAAFDASTGDDVLRLMFIACHPVLSTEARVALTLRLLGGLSTEEIARAFLTPEPTVAQRIVRAKRTLKEARVPFELPQGGELTERVGSVLEVLYLVFNEGYAATKGDDWMRPELCENAMRLGRILAQLVPDEPEVHGLVALMELSASRTRARVTRSGEPILLMDQDRSRWDRLLIQRGLAALERAEQLKRPLGTYTLQAAIAACHARALRPEDTDWEKIVALYDALAVLTQSPVVELNRAVAVAMAHGPHAGLELIDELTKEPALARYHLLPSVRADLLLKLERHAEAQREFERAAFLATNERERELLLARAKACAGSSG